MSNTKPRILLVEDDLALATAYRIRMEAEGFDVRHCPNGEEAMQKPWNTTPTSSCSTL
jgi:DNA-binding response OmpR family regulator